MWKRFKKVKYRLYHGETDAIYKYIVHSPPPSHPRGRNEEKTSIPLLRATT